MTLDDNTNDSVSDNMYNLNDNTNNIADGNIGDINGYRLIDWSADRCVGTSILNSPHGDSQSVVSH